MILCDLEKAQCGVVTHFSDENVGLVTRLREIGFAEGDRVQVMHFGLFGKNPLTVRLNGALIALRRREAKLISVRLETEDIASNAL